MLNTRTFYLLIELILLRITYPMKIITKYDEKNYKRLVSKRWSSINSRDDMSSSKKDSMSIHVCVCMEPFLTFVVGFSALLLH